MIRYALVPVVLAAGVTLAEPMEAAGQTPAAEAARQRSAAEHMEAAGQRSAAEPTHPLTHIPLVDARPWPSARADLPGTAQASEGAGVAAHVVSAILSGEDGPAAWGALEAALGSAGGSPETDSPSGLASLTDDMAMPRWLGSLATGRVVVGVVAALLVVLVLLAVRLVIGLLARSAGTVAAGGRRQPFLRRRSRSAPLSRDAERLHAQLRARRVA